MTSTRAVSDFETTDPEAGHAFLTTAYGTGMRIRWRSRAGWRLRHQRVDAGAFRLESTSQSTHLVLTVDPQRAHVVCRSTTSRLVRRCGADEGRHGPGEVFLANRAGSPHTARWLPGGLEVCVLDPDLLAGVAATAPARHPAPLRFTRFEPVTPAGARLWSSARRYVAGLLADPATAAQPLLVANAAHLLATVTLAVFPNTALTDPTAQERRDATPTALRRAVAFIEDNAARDIDVAAIAAAANVGIRAVQLAFRRHLGTTPTAYLRRVRLDLAHRELLSTDPRDGTVSAIAARWGFASHSRFTAHYRAAYGVPPSRTLALR
ncbi:helix-turn-helix domain-containing protein [Saccharothrix coeruleofusca]|uniref:AraC family transcriptional regulator n=1 Tax=Saccharothrix coeruleofusca TaxID=33919 RepID=A0A918ALU5_9PSEU|nr:helix-turn-helix domain-containing protein [Saccharothrix coeruleofusca]GGP55413.1 AraC family transcriptional regulator [Saccharothrix coeruleofusca]